MEMVSVQFGCFAVLPELSLKLHLIPPQCFAADRAHLAAPGTARDAVGTSRRQLPILDCFAGLLAQNRLVAHGLSRGSTEVGKCQMPGGRTPVRVTLGARWKAT